MVIMQHYNHVLADKHHGGLVRLWVFKRDFKQYLSYMVAISFISDGNRSTQRRLYHINISSAPSTVNDRSHNFNIVIGYTGRCHSDYYTIMTTTPLKYSR